MPHSPHSSRIDLQEVTDRNRSARRIVAGFSTTLPMLSRFWRTLETALADTDTLSAELHRLRTDHANLLAATRATLSAHHDGEPDPLFYLRDELHAHGHAQGPAW
jgi:hypothetical protein